ncbi:unnamed protein product [Closterium sp. NIES-54]
MRHVSGSGVLVPLSAIPPRTSSPLALFPVFSLALSLTRLVGSFTTPPRAVSSPLRTSRSTSRFPFTVSSPTTLPLSPPPPLFLAPGAPQVTGDSGPTEGGPARGPASGGAEPGGVEPGGAEPGDAEPGREESRGAEPGGTEPGGAAHGGAEASGAGAGESATGVVYAGGSGADAVAGAGGSELEGAAAGDTEAGDPGTGGAGSGGAAAGGAGPGGAGAEGSGAARGAGTAGGAGAAGAGSSAQPRLFFAPPSPSSQPPSDSVLRQVLSLPSSTGFPLQPGSPLPAPSPYTEQTGGLTERREPASRPVSPVRSGRAGRRSVPLPSPPASSLPTVPEPESDRARAAHPTVMRLLATVVTDPSFESTAASALVVELVDFAAACRLNYAASLVAESESVCPPSVWGDCALGTDVLEDRQEDLECLAAATPHLVSMLLAPEGDPDAPDIPTPRSYAEAIVGEYSSQWQTAMDAEMASWKSTGTYVDEVPPPGANIVSGMWIFRVKWPPGSPPVFKARYVARGFSQQEGVDFFQTFSLTPKMTTLRWHDTQRTTLAALGFAPSTADPSLFLRTDTSLPPFYILVYVDDLVFATTDTEALALVKSELQKRHTCTYLGELRSYLGLQITWDRARRTITPTQSHMVQQVLQHFGFTWSSAQATPLATGHSLSAPPSNESVEPSGPYPELVGCLITSGMGLVLGGRGDVVLTGHSDASWVDNQATQRSSQGYTFSLGSGSVSCRSTRSSSVLRSTCEAEIYATAMAAQELRWLTYLLTDLGERPRSPPVLVKKQE